MPLSRKERRALQHQRELLGQPKARPWQYQRECAERRKEAALLRDLMILAHKHGLDLESVTKALMSVTGVLQSDESMRS